MKTKLKNSEIIAEGAEAKIYSLPVKGLACVLKDRIRKNYRLPAIDKRLRKLRTRHERKLLARAARRGVNVPKIIDLAALGDLKDKKSKLCIEEIPGSKVRDYALENESDSDKIKSIFAKVGKQIGKLHKADITHGDLTTSNMIYDGEKVYIIDLGLGQISKRREDKAVDLHLLKECLKSKHFPCWELAWGVVVSEYKKLCGDQVFNQLRKVEARGRYRKLGD